MKIIDLHCDSLYKFIEAEESYSFLENGGHVSQLSLLKGGYYAQCFAIYIPQELKGDTAFQFFKKQYKRYLEVIKQCTGLATANDRIQIYDNFKKDKISALLTVENAELLNNNLNNIEVIKNCKVKILGLIHNGENCIGYPHTEDGGLKQFGKEAVSALNNTDIIVDVSHLNRDGFFDVAAISKKPFIASHSACRSLQEHTRNLTNEQIRVIANAGGIIGIPFYSLFLNGSNKTECDDVLHHFEHLIKIGGEDVAALGTDFDGMECDLFLKNCGQMQFFAEKAIEKFGHKIAEKLCYKNFLRIL